MGDWFHETIVASGRLPLFSFFTAVIVGFGVIRTSNRLIRARVRWWPGNVPVGGLHVHHAVFGVVMMLIGGVTGLAVPVALTGWRSAAAALFGVGAALVLDEFALILRLRDVYWSTEGRDSVDAVFVAVAATGLLLVGVRPAWTTLEAASEGVSVVPLLLGSGVRLFDHLGAGPIALEQTRVIESAGVTHLRYRVVRD